MKAALTEVLEEPQISRRVTSAAEGIQILDGFQNVMCVHISLAKNKALEDFTNNIRWRKLMSLFKGIMDEPTLEKTFLLNIKAMIRTTR